MRKKVNLIGVSGKIKSGKDTVGTIIQYLTSNYYQEGKSYERYLQKVESDWGRPQSIWQVKKFADKLKDIVCLLIGCSREDLENQKFKETYLGEEWDKWCFSSTYSSYHLTKDSAIEEAKEYYEYIKKAPSKYSISYEEAVEQSVSKIRLTPRDLLQLLGTECGRKIIHPNIWVNSTFADYDTSFTWLITDTRFENETKAISQRQGINIRVNRPIEKRFPELWNKYTNDSTTQKTEKDFYVWLKLNDFETWTKLIHSSETSLDDYNFNYIIDNDGSIQELIEKVKKILITEKLIIK